jgi:hypothetical protein
MQQPQPCGMLTHDRLPSWQGAVIQSSSSNVPLRPYATTRTPLLNNHHSRRCVWQQCCTDVQSIVSFACWRCNGMQSAQQTVYPASAQGCRGRRRAATAGGAVGAGRLPGGIARVLWPARERRALPACGCQVNSHIAYCKTIPVEQLQIPCRHDRCKFGIVPVRALYVQQCRMADSTGAQFTTHICPSFLMPYSQGCQ